MAYAIGVDFGTESGRILLLDLDTGREAGSSVVVYPHRVMDERLWVSGEILPRDWALQDPDDYVHVLQRIVEALSSSGIDPRQVIGLGIDFTACTVLPVKRDGTPLCRRPEMSNRECTSFCVNGISL